MIPLSSASTYPTTEQTLASVSVLLNGGGLGQLQEINQTFAKALAGRENDMRSLLTQLDTFIANLNSQTDDIIAATESLNSLAGQVAAKDETVDRALTDDPAGACRAGGVRDKLAERGRLRSASSARSPPRRSTRPRSRWCPTCATSRRCCGNSPTPGPRSPRALDFLSTYPWVKSTIPNWFSGDFANITLVVDLTLSRIDSSLFTGTRWEGDLTELELQWGRTIGQMPSPYTAGNPLIAPYRWGRTDAATDRTVWTQLAILAAVTVIACGVMAFGFVKFPRCSESGGTT